MKYAAISVALVAACVSPHSGPTPRREAFYESVARTFADSLRAMTRVLFGDTVVRVSVLVEHLPADSTVGSRAGAHGDTATGFARLSPSLRAARVAVLHHLFLPVGDIGTWMDCRGGLAPERASCPSGPYALAIFMMPEHPADHDSAGVILLGSEPEFTVLGAEYTMVYANGRWRVDKSQWRSVVTCPLQFMPRQPKLCRREFDQATDSSGPASPR